MIPGNARIVPLQRSAALDEVFGNARSKLKGRTEMSGPGRANESQMFSF